MATAVLPTAAVQPWSINPATIGYRFRDALTTETLSVIAEIKRRSPSRGPLNSDLDPAKLARQYQSGGAACLSVLTDRHRFDGSPDDLRAAKAAVDIPVLRKDFLTTPAHIYDTADMGADALLLIVSDIGIETCQSLQELALTLGLDVVVEVRTGDELLQAAEAGAYMIAVNQRSDPKHRKCSLDYDNAHRVSGLFDRIHPDITLIAASGIGVTNGTPVAAITAAGYDAALIGEALVTAQNPEAELGRLIG